MKLVIQTNDPVRLAFAEACLLAEGIAPFVLDVHTSALIGGGGIWPRRLMVADEDALRAAEILRDLGALE